MADAPIKILIADDEPDIIEIISFHLMKAGFDIATARDGSEAIEKAKQFEPDCIILDVMMPYKDGYTLAKEIRDKNKEVPIVFLTAKSMKEDVLKGYKVGADDYLNKPFDSEVLLMKIKAIMKLI